MIIAQQNTAAATFTKEQLAADADFLVKTIENVHPNPYHAISKEKYHQLRDSVVNRFKGGLSAQEAWPGFARMIAALDEGHSTLRQPTEFVQEIQAGKTKVFPILLKEFDGEGLVVRYDLSDDSLMKAGDIILSINGKSAAELMNFFTSFEGGLSSWRQAQVLRDFAGNLALHNIGSPYRLEYLHNGDKREIIVNGLFFPQLAERAAEIRRKNTSSTARTDYRFDRLDNITGYLDFRSMRNLDGFKKFLDSVFTDIKNNPVDGLIIDLRQNGGGNSELGEALLSYITDKPFRMGAGSIWKVSDEYKEQIRREAKNNPVYASGSFQFYLNYKTGDLITGSSRKPSKPANNPLRFSGSVCVLIGPNTFSSANMLTNAIKDFQLATLIGEATGEPPNDYGELYWNKLPNTQLGFTTCSKQFIRANGDKDDPDPVFPDIEVRQDRHSTNDDVLEFAKEWIRKK